MPAIEKALSKDLASAKKKPSVEGWKEDVRDLVRRHGIMLHRHVHTPNYTRSAEVKIEPSHPSWSELDVVELRNEWNNSSVKIALNAKLAKKLLDDIEAEWKKKAAKKSDRQDAKAAKAKAELTPAERKKHEAEQRRKFEQRLENWFYDWLRVLCAAAVRPGGLCANCEQGAVWITAWALWGRPGNEYREREVLEELAGYKAKQYESDVVLKVLETRDGNGAGDLIHAYAARLLVDADGAPRGPTGGVNPVVFDRVVAVLSRHVLGLDLPAAWRDDRDSPMREKFWNLHSKDQLAELGEELGVFVDEKLKKSQAVDVFLNQPKPLPLPKELAKLVSQLKPSKAKGTTKGTKITKRKPR